jgi:cyclophilin family peptidyl-prolyl cis-trans isomerase
MKTATIFNILLLLFFFSSCEGKNAESDNKISETTKDSKKVIQVDNKGLSKSTVTIKTVHGNIIFKLYPEQAPITVARIIELTNEGFYDGLTFHRVVPGFVIQGGDPAGDGTGGSGKKLKAEFSKLQHVKGSVAMARAAGDVDSADSQFYIALNTLPHLDGSYTVFGQVIEGLDIVERVQKGDKIISMSFNESGN